MSTITEQVHISQVKAGDTIVHNGREMTVGHKDIKPDPFMGVSIFGDSYRSGRQKVTRVLFTRWWKGEAVGLVAQR